jgi:hypothetical protein
MARSRKRGDVKFKVERENFGWDTKCCGEKTVKVTILNQSQIAQADVSPNKHLVG